VSDKQQLWTLVTETMQAFMPFYREAMMKAIEESGVPDAWFALSLARGMDPEPFSLQRFHDMYPYMALQRQRDVLEELAREDGLEAVGENAYRITDIGREIVQDIYHAARESLKTVAHLPLSEMEQLNNLLLRLVEATLNAPEPENKWAIAASRANDPGENWGEAAKTDQYLTDLYMFRDDAHIAAWKPYGVSGRTWETLSFIWEEQAHTAAKLAEKRSPRGFTQQDYTQSLAELVKLGWIEPAAEGYQITEKGRALRQEAEDTTNHYFFAPWDSLNSEEQAQLYDLLNRLKDKLSQ
jgi:DNA-binding MarR family transcriptional regulator